MIPNHSVAKPAPLELNKMSEAALITLRQQIDNYLDLSLKSINMEEELALQLKQAKYLYSEISDDANTPANQKAQVLNSLSSIIGAISKTSTEVYSVARLKKIEAATLSAVKTLPEDAKQRFFTLYAEYLGVDV